MTAAAGSLLEVRDLTKTFRRGTRSVAAIAGFSLMVETGEFVAIVGPSGCGKSTFLHILGGFEPADSGTMLLNGEPMTGRDRTAACCSRNSRCIPGAR